MNKVFIGTSGWMYYHWKGIFYPKGLSNKNMLQYFSKNFKTVEINSSFYHQIKETTYKNWYSQVPDDFVFSIKINRIITYIKKLKNI